MRRAALPGRATPTYLSQNRSQQKSYVRKPPAVLEKPRQGIGFSTTETISILISIATMVIAFQMFGVGDYGLVMGVVLGIAAHEVSHKIVAQSLGFRSTYKLWEPGLVLVIAFAIITKGKFIFAAPGFVHTEGDASLSEKGIISLSAPAANIALALLFLIFATPLALSAAYVNILLATFNLLPIGPLDGTAVMEWNQGIWAAAFVLCLVLGFVFIM